MFNDEGPNRSVWCLRRPRLLSFAVTFGVCCGTAEATADEPRSTTVSHGLADETLADETLADETLADETLADETLADETLADETLADETLADEGAAPSEPLTGDPGATGGGAIEPDAELSELRRLADRVLAEGVQDLGLPLALSVPASSRVDEQRLIEGARGGYAIGLELTRERKALLLRVVAVTPDDSKLQVFRVRVQPANLELSLLRVLRDLQRSGSTSKPTPCAREPLGGGEPAPRDSDGRAYLAVTGAVVGGYVGFSLEHIAGTSDTRLIYPLMTLGAGVGVGASLVAADEWEITTGEAWYLSAATLWSTTSALLITDGVRLSSPSHRHAYGLLGTTLGLSLGTVAISTSHIGQGGALLTHSGAIFGGLFGALTERMIEPVLDERPTLGLGVGAASGTLLAGFLATQLPDPPPTRLVYIDLSAFLGALTGAAAASPVLVGNVVSDTESRVFIGSVFGGALLGGLLGYTLTDAETAPSERAPATTRLNWLPTVVGVDFGQAHGPRPWAVGVTGEF